MGVKGIEDKNFIEELLKNKNFLRRLLLKLCKDYFNF